MIDQQKLEDTGNRVGELFSLADEIDQGVLNEIIRMTDHPMAKVVMPLITEQLKVETGLKFIPTTEMNEAMKLLSFFLTEWKKIGFKNAVEESARKEDTDGR